MIDLGPFAHGTDEPARIVRDIAKRRGDDWDIAELLRLLVLIENDKRVLRGEKRV